MAAFIVGVTGGIGSGKTTVTDLFAARGITIVDADVIAKAVVAPGEPLLAAIAQAFGAGVLTPAGELNRAYLRDLIFSDETAKARLNALMHPVIRRAIEHELNQARSPYVILSAPLLLENQLDRLCQRVLVVDVTAAQQRARTSARDGVSDNQVKAIMSAQIDRTSRLARADDIIDNNGDIDALEPQVERLHAQYLAIATAI